MYDYVTRELPELIEATSRSRRSAPSAATPWGPRRPHRRPARTRVATARCRPSAPSATRSCRCPGARRPSAPTSATTPLWQEWDACQLLRHHDSPPLPTLVDVGLDDPFLAGAARHRHPGRRRLAATRAWPLTLNRHAGYDHSYYFVASFIEAHLRFHANHLGEPA